MPESNECPECGKTLPPDAPRRLCPRCLLTQGLMNDDLDSFDALTHAPSVVSSSSANGLVGNPDHVPHVSLRDTELGDALPVSRVAPALLPDSPGASGRYLLFGEIARGGMGAIFKGAIRTSAATWPSRSSSNSTATIPSSFGASSKRRGSAGSSSIPALCRSTSWARSLTSGRISP